MTDKCRKSTETAKLSGNALLAEYANLAALHDALAVLVGYDIITPSQRIEYTRKFLADRPKFRKAVEEAMNAGISNGS